MIIWKVEMRRWEPKGGWKYKSIKVSAESQKEAEQKASVQLGVGWELWLINQIGKSQSND